MTVGNRMTAGTNYEPVGEPKERPFWPTTGECLPIASAWSIAGQWNCPALAWLFYIPRLIVLAKVGLAYIMRNRLERLPLGACRLLLTGSERSGMLIGRAILL
jgi:hypothetical protein